MIEWKDQFSVKNEELDMQHQKLFVLVNHILESMKTEKAKDTTFINDILNQLYDYTQYHFKDEEAYMEQIGYAGLEAQRKAHDAFINRLEEMNLEEVDEHQQQTLEEMMEFLTGWLVNHILHMDKKIK